MHFVAFLAQAVGNQSPHLEIVLGDDDPRGAVDVRHGHELCGSDFHTVKECTVRASKRQRRLRGKAVIARTYQLSRAVDRVKATRSCRSDTGLPLLLCLEVFELPIQRFALDAENPRSGSLIPGDRLQYMQNVPALNLF